MSGISHQSCAACRGVAAPCFRLCRDCRDQLAEWLGGLRACSRGTRVTARAVLASWAQVVVDGRAVARPARSVAGMAEFLCRHVDWLAAHPAAAEIVGEFAQLAVDSRQVVTAS